MPQAPAMSRDVRPLMLTSRGVPLRVFGNVCGDTSDGVDGICIGSLRMKRFVQANESDAISSWGEGGGNGDR